jgi:hypothetical protein
MSFKKFLDEGYSKKIKIQEGDFTGQIGKIVFSKEAHSERRYYVVELDHPVKGVEVVIVFNGEFDYE